MCYRERYTSEIWEKLHLNGGVLDMYNDFCCGSDYLKAVKDGQISPNDMVLLFSINGAQLYRNKKSDCWIYIWVILDLPPDKQYKMKHVLPGGLIPGNPQHLSSFMYPGLYHVSALQHEGLSIYDGFQQVVTSYPVPGYLFLFFLLSYLITLLYRLRSFGSRRFGSPRCHHLATSTIAHWL